MALTDRSLAEGTQYLCQTDADLAALFDRFGTPPMWAREPGFPALVQIILEQQVSLASGRAAYNRLLDIVSPLTPERFLALDDTHLKTAGFSRQKSRYCRHLAESITGGQLDLHALETMDDEAVKSALIQVKGIGQWTSNLYLLMALKRADVWPAGDLALAVAVHQIKKLKKLPSTRELEVISEKWRPYRAVAARLLWQYYLNRPTKTR